MSSVTPVGAAAFLLSERGFDVALLKDGINALRKANPSAA